MIKSMVKNGAARLIAALGNNPNAPRVTILCYHSIHPTKIFSSADPTLFEEHLAWLVAHCNVIDLGKAIDCSRSAASKQPAVVITFDDGYRDNYDYVFPLLARYGLPATFFVTTGFVERRPDVMQAFQRTRNSSLADVEPMSWGQIHEMRDAGFEFGSHTVTHPNLFRLDDDRVRAELRESREVLQQTLSTKIEKIAYPFGKPRRHFSERTMALAAEAGYTTGAAALFRGVRASDSGLKLPRFFVTRDSTETLKQKVFGSWDFVGRWQETAPVWAAKLVSPADFRV